MYDVIVVGGGPGGLHSATLLARAGFDVVLLEEHAATGQPVHCTGVLATEAFSEFGLSRESILNPLSTARFYSPSGVSISYTTPTTEALVVDRALFDQHLYEQARAAGVTVMLDARVSGIDVGPDAVTVTTHRRTIQGRACVLACGANYSLHRSLGLGMPAAYLRSAQLELKAERTGDVEVHFGNDVAPKGFAWVVPVQRGNDRYARVGLMCDSDAAGYFHDFVDRMRESWGLSLDCHRDDASSGLKTRRYVPEQTPSQYVGWGIQTRPGQTRPVPRQKMLPLAPIEKTFAPRVLAVGDAAGLVKGTTGGGIYYSLVSASIAADVLGQALHRDTLDASTLGRYQTLCQRRLGSELKAQYSLRELAERLDDDEIEALFDLAQTNGVMPIVRRTARFNQHRNLIVTLLRHPPSRRLLYKELVARASVFSPR